ncbi:MAG: histidinol-phosphatase HisJ family protein [Eubacteriaceae bacterium]
MKADNHIHTIFSDDSDCPMEDMVKRGIDLGLNEMTFTDHVDYGVKDEENCQYDQYFDETARLSEKYGDRICIKTGIEFGMQKEYIEEFQRDFDTHPFDFVILSNHQIGNQEFWTGEYQRGKTQDQINRGYYEAILEVMKLYHDYSVLGHLDMIKRYDNYGEYPDEKVMDLIDAILRQVIADGKGIEVNTSCFHYGLSDLTPSRNILKRYHELGGKIITIGSDAHATEYLADHIDYVKDELKKLGYDEFCTFSQMNPEFHPL